MKEQELDECENANQTKLGIEQEDGSVNCLCSNNQLTDCGRIIKMKELDKYESLPDKVGNSARR